MELGHVSFAGRWNMGRSLSASESSVSLQSFCSSYISTDTSLNSSDIDDDSVYARRTYTIYDLDEYLARRQRIVAEPIVADEGAHEDDDSSSADSSSDDDGASFVARRTETIYDFDAYFVPRQPSVADGSADDEADDNIPNGARAEDDASSSDDDDASVFPRRTETMYDWDEYLAGRDTRVADGSGEDEDVGSVSIFARAGDASSSDGDNASLFPRRTETNYDWDEDMAGRDTRVDDEGVGSTFDAARTRHDSSSDREGLLVRGRTAKMGDMDVVFAKNPTHVAESIGGAEGHVISSHPCRSNLPTSSSSNDRDVTPSSSSHMLAKSNSLAPDDARYHATQRRPWTENSSRECFGPGEYGSSSLAVAREFASAVAVAKTVPENALGESAALAPSVHADFPDEVRSAHAVDVPCTPTRKSIIAMARARRG
eukprot:TRINITY_DN7197_c0_g1_i3.p1 TRINITY_DN7197_c0_g1~~TRINITY_DN7197_c0_g1_i3.p1  ORF type:complete len:429 (+),score=76.30 TRINITY_DN7197_c0_g1_i3:56-1342(+)